MSSSVSGLVLGWHSGYRMLLSPRAPELAQSANVLLGDSLLPIDLSGLATLAIDAATAAGASFADIRIAQRVLFQVGCGNEDHGRGTAYTWLDPTITYGIRVIANGAMASIHGGIPDGDRIAAAARDAVATARGYAAAGAEKVELLPVTPARGKWETPIKIDPFTVPLREQLDVLWAWRAAGERVVDIGVSGPACSWTRETRVFASSEGALTEQIFHRSAPGINCTGQAAVFQVVGLQPAHLVASAAGYESILATDVEARIGAAAEEAMELSRLPERRFDVGRYPIVFDGRSLGSVFGRTIAPALELDRVLGYEADAAGTSFLAPPDQVLGKLTINPLLSVTADRTVPYAGAAKWDDEGVEAEPYTVIKDGVVVDYHTSRQTAPALAAWYQKQGRPLRPHGCAMTDLADEPVMVRAPHMTIAAGKQSATLEELYRNMTKGLVVRQLGLYMSTDSAFATGAIHYAAAILEVSHGKVIGRVRDVGLQFATAKFWQGLEALGDNRTVDDATAWNSKGYPWRFADLTTSAPAGLFQTINVIDTGRTV